MATDGVVMHLDALLALSRELQESLSESAEQIEECNGPNSIVLNFNTFVSGQVKFY